MTRLSFPSARSFLFLYALALLGACGEEESPSDDARDAAASAGDAAADAGASTDASTSTDASSSTDASTSADASQDNDASTGALCGGFAGFQCAAGQFCDYAAGTGCEGISDASGACTATPEVCADIYAPVCGCDHRTYENACSANAAGVSVMREGMCTAEDCDQLGGRIVTSDGASTPVCAAGESGFRIPGRELVLCCTTD